MRIMHVSSAAQLGRTLNVVLQVVAYTPRGRAYNSASGSLGATANAAFLATTYSATEMYSNAALAARYVCWARSQIRYMLGDADQSYVVGYGARAPAHADNRAASCPPPPQQCNAVTGLLNPNSNPNILYGALVEGALFSDKFQDVRALNSTNVQIDYNAGFQACPVRPCALEYRTLKPLHCKALSFLQGSSFLWLHSGLARIVNRSHMPGRAPWRVCRRPAAHGRSACRALARSPRTKLFVAASERGAPRCFHGLQLGLMHLVGSSLTGFMVGLNV